MKGKLIHTEHRTSDVSEYYFNNSSKLILEVKNLRFNKIREYQYSLEQFSKLNRETKLEKIVREKVNDLLGNFKIY